MEKFNLKRFGFTLLELVIVVAILAILALAAITAYQNLTSKAKAAQCKAILASVRSAIRIQRAKNEVGSGAQQDAWGHPRVNSWPTFEEVRRARYESTLDDSIMDTVIPQNSFKAVNPPFGNQFQPDTSGFVYYNNPDLEDQGGNLSSHDRVWATNQPKGSLCAHPDCPTGWFYNPATGEFWADSNEMGENLW